MADPMLIPRLVGGSVTLRPHEPTDLGAVLERSVDPVTRSFTAVPLDFTREMAADYLAAIRVPRPEAASWAIEVDGTYAGTIDLRRQAASFGDLGFVTHPAFRGRGVMTAAIGLVVAHAFDSLGWEALQWKARAGNWASAKAVWRNGFPVPTVVPSLLVERDEVVDGWISTLHSDAAREPVAAWDRVVAGLTPATRRDT